MPQIAIVQHPPCFLDRAATITRAAHLIQQATEAGARLVVFPEAFIPGYPAWIWRLRPGGDWGLSEELHARLLDNAVVLERGDLQPLYEMARQCEVTVVCGINERGSKLSRSTLYNTVITIGSDGSLQNRHRKLMPTHDLGFWRCIRP